MNNIKSLGRIKPILYICYLIIAIISLLVLYIIITNYQKANSINPKLVETHSTQLDIEEFNKVLEEIKNR